MRPNTRQLSSHIPAHDDATTGLAESFDAVSPVFTATELVWSMTTCVWLTMGSAEAVVVTVCMASIPKITAMSVTVASNNNRRNARAAGTWACNADTSISPTSHRACNGQHPSPYEPVARWEPGQLSPTRDALVSSMTSALWTADQSGPCGYARVLSDLCRGVQPLRAGVHSITFRTRARQRSNGRQTDEGSRSDLSRSVGPRVVPAAHTSHAGLCPAACTPTGRWPRPGLPARRRPGPRPGF